MKRVWMGMCVVVLSMLLFTTGAVDKVSKIERPTVSPVLLDVRTTAGGGLSKIQVVAVTTAAAGMNKAVVDDDGVDCPGADFATIQDAVDAGAKRIEICAGTYPENVVIGPGATTKLEGSGNPVVTGVAGTAGPILDVLPGSDVDILSLTVDGGSAMMGGVVWGIRYDEADGTLRDVNVKNIRNPSGSSQGLGIRVQSSGAPTRVVVDSSWVENYTRVGVSADGIGVDVTLGNTAISGPLLPRVWAPNGVQISRGAEGHVRHNEVDNNPSPNPPGGAGSGILFFCGGTASAHHNTVTGADLGIALADNANAHVHNNEISDSRFDAISLQVIGTIFGPLGCPAFPSPTTDNFVHNNTAMDSADTGISFALFDGALDPAMVLTGNIVSSNDVDGSGFDGIHVFDGEGNDIRSNRIGTSGATDAVDDTTGGGTAGTANTWKNNRCSSSSPAGLCK